MTDLAFFSEFDLSAVSTKTPGTNNILLQAKLRNVNVEKVTLATNSSPVQATCGKKKFKDATSRFLRSNEISQGSWSWCEVSELEIASGVHDECTIACGIIQARGSPCAPLRRAAAYSRVGGGATYVFVVNAFCGCPQRLHLRQS